MQRLTAAFLILTACGGGGSDKPVDAGPVEPEPDATPGGFDKRELLIASADCVVGEYQAFRTAALALEAAATAFAAAPDEPSRAAVQVAWQTAMDSWEIAELYQIGPAALSTEPGGQDLRDQIYSWPLTSACKIDEQLVSKAYEKATFATSLVSGRGLGALEYLIFYTGADNACGSFSPINAGGDGSPWKLVAAGELSARRAAYALAVAKVLVGNADQLLAAWDAGGFRAALVGAGNDSKLFASTQAGLNAVSNAFFYMDKAVKDAKIAVPTGMTGCAEATCPNLVESRYARRSLAHLDANLRGFERLFAGCSGNEAIGFDDWLIAADDGAGLAADLLAAVADTRAAITAIGSFEDVLASDPQKLRDLHAKFKVITDLLKADLVTVLDLELPASVESDND